MEPAEIIREESNNVIQKEEVRLMEKYSWVSDLAATDLYRSGVDVGIEIGINIVVNLVPLSNDQFQKFLTDISDFYQLNLNEVDI